MRFQVFTKSEGVVKVKENTTSPSLLAFEMQLKPARDSLSML
jgi:hypothetical protein